LKKEEKLKRFVPPEEEGFSKFKKDEPSLEDLKNKFIGKKKKKMEKEKEAINNENE